MAKEINPFSFTTYQEVGGIHDDAPPDSTAAAAAAAAAAGPPPPPEDTVSTQSPPTATSSADPTENPFSFFRAGTRQPAPPPAAPPAAAPTPASTASLPPISLPPIHAPSTGSSPPPPPHPHILDSPPLPSPTARHTASSHEASALLRRALAAEAELETARAQIAHYEAMDVGALRAEVARLKEKQARDREALTEYMDSIEGKVAKANARADAARARVRVLERRLASATAHQSDVKATATYASTQLLKIADLGEAGIKKLLSGMDDLRLAASTLANLDAIASVPDSDSDDDDP